jgi:hypothetical protein
MSYKPAARGTIRRFALRDYDGGIPTVKEIGMSTQNEGKDAKGRSYEQVTKDGSSSAATMGTGGTGDVGRMSGETAAGSAQSETRTDDWLSREPERESEQGFRPSDPEAIKTGMEGIGKLSGNQSGGKTGNRQ